MANWVLNKKYFEHATEGKNKNENYHAISASSNS